VAKRDVYTVTAGRNFLKLASITSAAFATLALPAASSPLRGDTSHLAKTKHDANWITITLTANLFEPALSQDVQPDQWSDEFDFGQNRVYRARLSSMFEETAFGPLYALEITDRNGSLIATNRLSDGASVTFMNLGLHAHVHIDNGFMSTTIERWASRQLPK
jgi:hypothetical protein